MVNGEYWGGVDGVYDWGVVDDWSVVDDGVVGWVGFDDGGWDDGFHYRYDRGGVDDGVGFYNWYNWGGMNDGVGFNDWYYWSNYVGFYNRYSVVNDWSWVRLYSSVGYNGMCMYDWSYQSWSSTSYTNYSQ